MTRLEDRQTLMAGREARAVPREWRHAVQPGDQHPRHLGDAVARLNPRTWRLPPIAGVGLHPDDGRSHVTGKYPEEDAMSAALDYTVTPITQHTGAEVRGLDLRDVCDEETAQKLRRVLADKGMIVFRDQKLDAPAFQRAGEIFGDIMPQTVARFTLPDHPLVGFVSSEDTDKPGGVRIVRGEQYHTCLLYTSDAADE